VHWRRAAARATSFICFLWLIVHASVALAGLRTNPAYENALRDRLSGIAPSAVQAWERGNKARDAHDVNAARSAYAEVVLSAPSFDAGHRRLCSVQEGDLAIASCRRAIALDTSWENQVALAITLMHLPAGRSARFSPQINEARRLLDQAEAASPQEATVLATQAQLALVVEDLERFLAYADRLERLAPGDPDNAAFNSLAALFRGDYAKARAELLRARAAGSIDPEFAANLERGIDDAESRWTPMRVAKAFGLTLVVWLACIGVLFGAGTLLSRSTLRATEADASNARSGEAVGGTRALKRAYGALITAASIFYFASLPLVAALVLAGVGAVVYGTLIAGQVPIKLVLIVVLVGAASLWAILKGIYITLRPPKAEAPGEEVALPEHPKLQALLSSVAGRIGTRSVDRVFITPHTDMAVFERGGVLATARGKGERCLILGAGLVRGMRVGSLKGVLAHEFGHFKNEDTAGGALSLAVRRSMIQMLVALVQGGGAKIYNPAWIFATRYHGIFLRISQGASRLQEVLADRWAVLAYGSRPFVDGFEHVIARSVEHDVRVNTTLKDVIANDRPLLNLFTHAATLDATVLAEKQKEELDRAPDPYDSHPPPKQRIAAALALSVEHAPDPGDDEDAWHLFENREALEQLLTDRVCEVVASKIDVVIRRAAAPAAVEP
jgi:Zn-dependent protease with chaperone function